jgi:hypothetical protein
LATGAILSGIDYFLYKEPFDVKILDVSTGANYIASNISNSIMPDTNQQFLILQC